MRIADLLKDRFWDAPFFKVLASNDTGEATGHQGGMVIPKDLRKYFPGLIGTPTPHMPTLDHRIQAQLFVDEAFVETVETRYQFQTWSAGRTPESRLTGNLGPLRNRATGGDFLIIQRSIGDLDLYRLILVTKKDKIFESIEKQSNGKRWGLLTKDIPLTTEELGKAEEEEKEIEKSEFCMFDPSPKLIDSRSMKIARSIVFRKTILRIYGNKCCICGEGLITQRGVAEVQAAHIVSRSLKGTNDARNGLCLCTRHHWAFDNGLYGINKKRKIHVPAWVRSYIQNRSIADLHGKSLIEAVDEKLAADPSALEWHMVKLVRDSA
jgi:putative restriction endonuclease